MDSPALLVPLALKESGAVRATGDRLANRVLLGRKGHRVPRVISAPPASRDRRVTLATLGRVANQDQQVLMVPQVRRDQRAMPGARGL